MIEWGNAQAAFEAVTIPAEKLAKPKENWVILYQGKIMAIAGTKKMIWNKPGHALNALTRAYADAIGNQTHYYRYRQHPNKGKEPPPYEIQQKWLQDFKDWRAKNIQIVRYEECKQFLNKKA